MVEIEKVEVPIGLTKLVKRMAKRIKLSHGGWWKSYCGSDEIALVAYADDLPDELDCGDCIQFKVTCDGEAFVPGCREHRTKET